MKLKEVEKDLSEEIASEDVDVDPYEAFEGLASTEE